MTKRTENQFYIDVGVLKSEMNEIKTNHLPHLQDGIDRVAQKLDSHKESLDKKFWTIIILLISTLVGIIAANYK